MQHPCHQCGAPVDDGTPFCKQCKAPQIRVVTVPQSDIEPLRMPEPEDAPEPTLPSVQSSPIDWRSAWPSAFFVAVPAGLLAFALNPLFFLWTFGAGALSVSSYRKRTQAPVTRAMALRLGLFSGVVAFAVFLSVFLMAMARPEFSSALRQQMKTTVDRVAQQNPAPNSQKTAEILTSPDGFATMILLVNGMFAVLFIVFAVIGAMAGITVFAPKNRAP
ncbi:MAG: hypothetical protein ACJ71N_00680 [Terriglobales bacterium]